MKYENLKRDQMCCDSTTQRLEYERAEIWRAKYHEAKRECEHKAAEFYRREFEHCNRIIGNVLNIEQAA